MSFPLILQVQRLGKSGRMNSAGISVVIVIWWILLTHTNEISQSQLQTKKKQNKTNRNPIFKNIQRHSGSKYKTQRTNANKCN